MLEIGFVTYRRLASIACRAAALPLLVSALAGCSAPPNERVSYISAVGTPLYAVLKIPACAATLLIAAPVGALQGLAAPDEQSNDTDARPELDAGIADNCGPPYILPPE